MRGLRSQEEIMASWKGNPDKPVVSICCITYNHEPYIEDALEGFLIQETDFPFEILIHDDASTDRTAHIIREYESKYPKLIKPIYQTENQYRKGKKINVEFNFTRARGEFIALCEGDDYWLDSNKLQLQTAIHWHDRDISLSCHKALEKNIKDRSEKTIYMLSASDHVITAEDVIIRKGGYIPTASIMMSTEYMGDLVGFFRFVKPPVGDYFIQVFLALHGKVYYISSLTAVYRKSVSGSWTESLKKKENKLTHQKSMIHALEITWKYFRNKPPTHVIAVLWAHYAIGIARAEESRFARVRKLIALSPKLTFQSTRLVFTYYSSVLIGLAQVLKKYINR